MLECYSTNATVAKIRAIHGTMLTKEDYHELINRRQISEVAEYLKKCPRFKEVLDSVDSNTIHRGYLESLLTKSNFDIYTRLVRFQMLDNHPFYEFRIQFMEINQLLSFITSMNSKQDTSFVENLPGYFLKHTHIDFLALSKCETPEDMLNVLRNTPYYKVLVKIAPLDDGRLDYTACEVALRTFNYNRLLKTVKKNFSNKDMQDIERIICTQADLINIINAYRMKKYFGYTKEQIEHNSLPFTRIGKLKMQAYYSCDTPEDMLAFLDRTIYGNTYGADSEYIETRVNAVTWHIVNHLVETSGSAPVVLYAFMLLCDIEVNNVVHIIEGIRYKVEPAMLEARMIVCPEQ